QTSFPAGGLTPDQQLLKAIVVSGEYFMHIGNNNRAWATAMYTKVLGRQPGTAEVNNLLAAVLNQYGTTRLGVAQNIANSPEHRARVFAGYYTAYLGRPASNGELRAWLATGLSDEKVLAQILSSSEYFPTGGAGSSNSGWIDKVYNDLLKRTTVGDSQAGSYVAQLNAGT